MCEYYIKKEMEIYRKYILGTYSSLLTKFNNKLVHDQVVLYRILNIFFGVQINSWFGNTVKKYQTKWVYPKINYIKIIEPKNENFL